MAVRWGFVGCGAVAHEVAEDFTLVSDAVIAGVTARHEDSAQRFAARFSVPRVHPDLESLLADPDIDIIYIATPHHLHHQHALAALRAGKPVVCEKPFTVDARQAREVIEAARRQQLFCMEAMWMRFFPLLREIRARAESGEFGTLRLLRADFGYPTPRDADNRFFNPALAGGALLDRGVYTLSLAQLLLGEPVEVQQLVTTAETGVDEQIACLLRYENGAIADLSASLSGLTANTAVLTGDQARVTIHEPFYRPDRFTIRRATPPASSGQTSSATGLKSRLLRQPALQRLRQTITPTIKHWLRDKTVTAHYPGHGYQFEIAEASRCLREGLSESPLMPLDDTLAVMTLMDRLHPAAHEPERPA